MRSIRDLLSRPFIERTAQGAYWLRKVIPELKTRRRVLGHERVTIGWWARNTIGRRVRLLGALLLDDQPALIFQLGGRDGDDEQASWVVDEAKYINAVRLLGNCNNVTLGEVPSHGWEIPELGVVHGADLDEPEFWENGDDL